MKRPLRALLLAAGLGKRLRPLTLRHPKCLMPIGGKPLLGLWLKKLEGLGCEAALINTHYLSEQVERFVGSYDNLKMEVKTQYEEDLLGTAGTFRRNLDFFCNSTGLLIHADNATSSDLQGLLVAHKNKPAHCLMTMLTFSSSNPTNCGIVETDSNGIVTGFHEKVKNPPGNCANGAVYLFDPSFVNWFQGLPSEAKDFSNDVVSKLIGRIQTWHVQEPYFDIGTPSSLSEARSSMDFLFEDKK